MKQLTTDKNEIKRAKLPHEIFTINVIVIHIFLSVTLLKFVSVHLAIPIPITLSLLIMAWTYIRTKGLSDEVSCFVKVQYNLALGRYKYLLISYAIYMLIIGIGALVTIDGATTMQGTNIIYSVFNILSVVPLFVTLLALAVIGSGSLFNVSKGEVPEKLITKYC